MSATHRGTGRSRCSVPASPGMRAGASPRLDAAGVGEVQPFRAEAVQRAARGEEVAHHRRGHEALDRLLVEARRQLAADVEQAVELVDLHGERAVDAAQLLVDEAVLDGRGRAGGEALEEARLLRPERPAPRPAARARGGRSDGPPCGSGTRARSPPARRRPAPARTEHSGTSARSTTSATEAGRPARRAAPVAPLAFGHVQSAARDTCSSPITMRSAASRISAPAERSSRGSCSGRGAR